jgi:hypothetical protein
MSKLRSINAPTTSFYGAQSLIVVLFAAISAFSCGDHHQSGSEAEETGLVPKTAQEQAERERRASYLLGEARKLDPVRRIEKLIDVAHVYFDTKAGPEAWQEMIFYLVDHSNDDPTRGLSELKLFAHRRPNCDELMVASKIYYNATKKVLIENPNHPEFKERDAMAEEGLKIWLEVVDRFMKDESLSRGFGFYFDAGMAYAFADEYTKTESTWAKVEELNIEADDNQRAGLLLRRADIFRQRLNDNKRALQLFKEAKVLFDGLGKKTSDVHREYVNNAIIEIEKAMN